MATDRPVVLSMAAGNQPDRPIGKWLLRGVGFLLAAFMVWLGFAAWYHLAPPVAAPGWHYRAMHLDLPRVSALAMGPSQQLYVSLEKRHGTGEILAIAANGERTQVLTGLSKPDCLSGWHCADPVG